MEMGERRRWPDRKRPWTMEVRCWEVGRDGQWVKAEPRTSEPASHRVREDSRLPQNMDLKDNCAQVQI
jgi:hypothetical protein